jgi:hypothetical protein
LSFLLAALLAGVAALGQPQTVNLVSSNATWKLFKGTNEASLPDATAWRLLSFNESGWTPAPATLYYGESVANGTFLSDMRSNYTTLYLRKKFLVTNVANVAELELFAVCDDGFIAWVNGHFAASYNVPGNELPFNATASGAAPEPVDFVGYPIPEPRQKLTNGYNELAVQVFNVSASSSDLVFDAVLVATMRSFPPVVTQVVPPAGLLTNLTQITVTFSKPVTGVDAGDLRINDLPAETMAGSGTTYTFSFPQPSWGTVQVAWDMRSGITDLDTPPNAFEPTGAESRWLYELYDPSAPLMSSITPPPGRAVRRLSQVEVLFNKPVEGVDASDLLINGTPATNVTGVAAGPYVFGFAEVPAGSVGTAWAPGHGIVDTSPEQHVFGGGSWQYTVDPLLPQPDVIINEFMAENGSGLKDEDTSKQDWIELYNRGSSPVNLEGWSLTDDPREPGQWVFPALTLPARQYLVVFASGKDRRGVSAYNKLHTNFKLAVYGEYLGLYNPESPRQVVSELAPEYPEQREDYSFARDTLGGWRYSDKPTPGAANALSTITNLVAPVHFSVQRGFFARPFVVSLATDTAGAEIRYTLDGSTPSATNGLYYTQPLAISSTRIVRAAAFRTNNLPSRVETHTYLYNLPATRRILPAISLVTSSNNLYGKTGIMEYNPRNTTQHGIAWERPVSAELIQPADNQGFQVDCGLRIQGGGYIRSLYNYRSTSLPESKYSFRLYFRGDYGPGRLDYPLFPGIPVQSFDKIVLRAGMNDSTNPFIRDEFARALAADVGQVASHGVFVNLFLNGVYKGYYNPTERIDEDFLQTWHGGGDKWDIIAAMSELREGDMTAWNSMRSFANTRPLTNVANYLEMEKRLDTTNFVEYLLPLIYGDTDDWPHNNWRAARERAPTGLFRFYVWDAEWSFGFNNSPSHNTIAGQLSSLSPPWGGTEMQQLFLKLKASPEFRLLFADRVHKHFFNDGAMTDARIKARYEQIKAAVVATISGFNNTIGSSWIPSRRRYLTNHLAAAGLLASSNAPVFSQFGGRVPKGFGLTMTASPGDIYYTTDGADPRIRFTGEVAPGAARFSVDSPVVLQSSALVRARTKWDTNWSAVTEARFQVEEFGSSLRITEIMYNPPGGDAYEFIELQNTSPLMVDLSGVSLQGVDFRFLEGSTLPGGARVLLISDFNPAAFSRRYPGVAIGGLFGGSLANGGERLALLDRQGRTVVSVDYDDANGWPPLADGGGYSLEILDANGDPDDPANWRASARPGGSPGEANPAPGLPPLRLNEVLACGGTNDPGAMGVSPPSGNELSSSDWVELFNASEAPANLAGWSLSDNGYPGRFVFPPGTILPPNGYLVMWCDAQTNAPGLHTGFALNRQGESLFLFNAAGEQVDALTFGQQIPGYSVGRLGARAGWVLTELTPGAGNAAATLGSPTNLVINEFVANAPPGGDDWLELFNQDTNLPVALQGLFLGTSNALFQVTALSFVAPGGYAVFHADENPGVDHVDFKLPASRGAVVLYDHNGAELNRVTYLTQAEGVSLGRLPDGAANLTNFLFSASPGGMNHVTAYGGVILNEFMARNESAVADPLGRVADWLELHNPTTNRLDLSGLRLGVGPTATETDQWTFPVGASIAANGFLVVWCDASRPASTNWQADLNLGRALPAEGGFIGLYGAAGPLLDLIQYGFQLVDRSAGRTGEGWRLLAEFTPGRPNGNPAALGDPANLRLNEWLASSTQGDWLEVFNADSLPVEMAGLTLTDDPSIAGQTNHLVGPLTFVAGGGWVRWRADGQVAKGPDHLRFNLDARGETVRIYSSGSVLIDGVDFLVQEPEVSEGRFPDGSTNVARFPASPSLGEANFLALTNLFINEVLTHTDPPLEDAIELVNTGKDPAPIGGWYLSDNPREPKKFRIPDNTVVPSRGFAVFYEYQFNPSPGSPGSFALNSAHGGEVLLSATDTNGVLTGYRAWATFGAAENGVSFGRRSSGWGTEFVPLLRRTFGVDYPATVAQFRTGPGLPNAAPKFGPVVINEIMYHPVSGTNALEIAEEEYLELHNLSAEPIRLYDPYHPTNRWKLAGAVDYTFPANTTLPGNSYTLIVGFDPTNNLGAATAFQAKYRLDGSVKLLGPYAGRLANAGETIQLLQPDSPQAPPHPDAGFVPYLLVDWVTYDDALPWPAAADGAGKSLQRRVAAQYGNDPANWKADLPTPGRDNSQVIPLDSDSDGLPDDWEELYGLNPRVATGDDGPEGDPDHDGLVNSQEFRFGADPRRVSVRILEVARVAGGISLVFNGVTGRSYTIEYCDSLLSGNWAVLSQTSPLSATQPTEITLRLTPGIKARFFRLSVSGQL